jgi:phosphoribosyl-ATP pyrophosphohydrolase
MTDILKELTAEIATKSGADPEQSYSAKLLAQGKEKICKKIGEEAAEVIIAALAQDNAALHGEIADLLYHISVLLVEKKTGWDAVFDILQQRRGISGIAEKAGRGKNNL